jgi:hypothetical protein
MVGTPGSGGARVHSCHRSVQLGTRLQPLGYALKALCHSDLSRSATTAKWRACLSEVEGNLPLAWRTEEEQLFRRLARAPFVDVLQPLRLFLGRTRFSRLYYYYSSPRSCSSSRRFP